MKGDQPNVQGADEQLLELYVPILPRSSFQVMGVFEVYVEVADLYNLLGRHSMMPGCS